MFITIYPKLATAIANLITLHATLAIGPNFCLTTIAIASIPALTHLARHRGCYLRAKFLYHIVTNGYLAASWHLSELPRFVWAGNWMLLGFWVGIFKLMLRLWVWIKVVKVALSWRWWRGLLRKHVCHLCNLSQTLFRALCQRFRMCADLRKWRAEMVYTVDNFLLEVLSTRGVAS